MLLWAIKLPDKYRQNHFFSNKLPPNAWWMIRFFPQTLCWVKVYSQWWKWWGTHKNTVSGVKVGGGGTAFPLTFHIYKTYLQLYSCFTRFLKNVHGTNIIYCAWTHLESSNSPLSQRKGMAGWTSPNGSIPELSLLTATGMLKAVGRLINTDDGGSLSNVF